MMDLVLDRVSKRYYVPSTPTGGRPRWGRLDEFWALREVSFSLERGQTLGIIGSNGAGKSTILKLLSGVTAPTAGEIMIRGRLSALIEVGSGFHPELTGRENIYLSGSILGMRRREITEKLDAIIDFAGVRDFIEVPVKHYSSGMYLRLGFSIAAHLEPDILLLDEVLAVGDAEFQTKCLERINQLHQHGRTIVFISHDLGAVERLCERVILMEHGRIADVGPAREITSKYLQRCGAAGVSQDGQRAVTGEVEITAVACHGGDGAETTSLRTGAPARVRVEYVARVPVPEAVIEVYFHPAGGGAYLPWCQLTTASPGRPGISLERGGGAVEFEIDAVGMHPGLYFGTATIRENLGAVTPIDRKMQCLAVRVDAGTAALGDFYMPHRWRQAPGSTRRLPAAD